jgi:hypothetical protein
MSRLTKLGLLFLLAGIIALGYQGIATFMGSDRTADDLVWKNLSLANIFGGFDAMSFEKQSFFGLREIFQFFAQIPLFLLMFGFALLCFFINAFTSKS